MIYLDNAATTLHKPECVLEAVMQAMTSMGNCGRGANAGALSAGRVIYQARAAVARLFGLDSPQRVCFTSNSTEALNTALKGLLMPGDHVITTETEHNSVLRPLYELENQGVFVDFLPADKKGNIHPEDIKGMIRENTKAIVCNHASNLTGNAADIHKIGEIAKEAGLLFIVDASQTAGSFHINMEKDHISVLCFTGHKGLMGPQGTGGLCIADGVEIRPLKSGGTGIQTYLHTQPQQYPERLEAGTLNGHGLAGLEAGICFIMDTGIDTIHKKEYDLMMKFYEGIKDIPGVIVYGDFTKDRAPIVALNIEGLDSGEVESILSEDYDIAVRSGGHCAPKMHEALGTKTGGAVRFSFGYFNTEEDVECAVTAVREIAEPE